jgi:SOS response associated peptidase (SRAP)
VCGRVRPSSNYSEIKIRLKFAPDAPAPNFEPDWNKPPTAPMLVAIRSVDGKRIPKMMKWGLIPRWARDEKIQYSTHNARSEEFGNKPEFRDAWKRGQRCLVVTDGYYEWKVLDPKGKKKQPYAIAMADDREIGPDPLLAARRDGHVLAKIIDVANQFKMRLANSLWRGLHVGGRGHDLRRCRRRELERRPHWRDLRNLRRPALGRR